ncbi:PilZ domain-containing protein [Desulfolutivibrio sulfoxidireducens]|uniref:PilZ domain-containing protein n=1 Tax=Desulfolutivibrio sulfoxidireducens TaxID=2773299 RepID=UPI00159D7039|nr:PilZ domain-containing protein [Desulfolutivibrio sulfoxidireducens]QLA17077.1 PilZ domain-containing protein [Desulfolutivibrio sulfoxidireducens]QLA20645.1 PilZ domain-containing protein [Desulfolutivibrio sulfoxidireducens]
MFGSLFKKAEKTDPRERRRAYRVSIKDLQVVVHGQSATFTFTAKDISALGVGVLTDAKAFTPGILIRLDIKQGGRILAAGLTATVVRAGGGVVGCQFQDMTKAQETILHSLVLEEQKRQAASRRPEAHCQAPLEGVEGSLTFVDPWTEAKKKGFFGKKK